MAHPVGTVKCENCDDNVPNHYWGKVKADGWFFQRDGRAYCPKHVPEWVANWRKEKEKK